MILQRTMRDKLVAGVCGVIAKEFGFNSTKVRWAFVLLMIFAGLSIAVYFIAWFLMPGDGDYGEYREAPNS